MYKVYADGICIHDPSMNEKYVIVTNAQITKEVNKADSFTFTIYEHNAGYQNLDQMKAGSVEVYSDENLIFRGRILNEVKGWNNQKTITCESEFAYFNDSRVRPYTFQGTVRAYLNLLVTQHNSQMPAGKQFTVGTVTVTDPNDNIVRASSEYPSTIAEMTEKLVNELGGYLLVRRENSVNYIDYLEDSNHSSTQSVMIGKNLLSISQRKDGSEIVTGIIPLGAQDKTTGERLTIKSVNNNIDYLEDAEAAAQYGKIFVTEIWDDVTVASNLKTKAQARLTELTSYVQSVELTAADLHELDTSIDEFGFFDYVPVSDPEHGIQDSFLITKKTIDLSNPANAKITLGKITKMSASERSASSAAKTKAYSMAGVSADFMADAIKNATDLIKGAEGGCVKFHYDASGHPTEILIMNAQNEASATKIWRWNIGGFGFSNDGGQSFSTAITMDGSIVADFIKAGTINANNGTYELNMQTGKIKMKDAEITGGTVNIHSAESSIVEVSRGNRIEQGGTNEYEYDALMYGLGFKVTKRIDTIIANNELGFFGNYTPFMHQSYSGGVGIMMFPGNMGETSSIEITAKGNIYSKYAPTQSSDRRLKHDIKPIEVSNLKELKPVSFKMNGDDSIHFGFVAQDVQETSFMDIVEVSSDGMMSIPYTEFIAFLVKGWQEHEKRIEELERQRRE